MEMPKEESVLMMITGVSYLRYKEVPGLGQKAHIALSTFLKILNFHFISLQEIFQVQVCLQSGLTYKGKDNRH